MSCAHFTMADVETLDYVLSHYAGREVGEPFCSEVLARAHAADCRLLGIVLDVTSASKHVLSDIKLMWNVDPNAADRETALDITRFTAELGAYLHGRSENGVINDSDPGWKMNCGWSTDRLVFTLKHRTTDLLFEELACLALKKKTPVGFRRELLEDLSRRSTDVSHHNLLHTFSKALSAAFAIF